MAAALTMFAACHRAGMLNTLGVVCSGLYMLWTQRGGSGAVSSIASLRWRPSTHLQFWFAMLGGGMNFLHYFFFLKAFEGAPSTVLLPLVQVASVSVFLGSSVVALLRHEPWLAPRSPSKCRGFLPKIENCPGVENPVLLCVERVGCPLLLLSTPPGFVS